MRNILVVENAWNWSECGKCCVWRGEKAGVFVAKECYQESFDGVDGGRYINENKGTRALMVLMEDGVEEIKARF